MNEAYDQVVGLRAVREYRDEALSDGDLNAILEAARWTGSAKNTQNWAFIVVDDPGQRDRLAACGSYTGPLRDAPVSIALVEEPDGYRFDTGRVAQNVMLAAQAIGVASCPVTLHREEAAAEVLGLPAGATCRFAVALGYPAEQIKPSRYGGRKPLDQVTHHNRYGD
jgi:nitroreductase